MRSLRSFPLRPTAASVLAMVHWIAQALVRNHQEVMPHLVFLQIAQQRTQAMALLMQLVPNMDNLMQEMTHLAKTMVWETMLPAKRVYKQVLLTKLVLEVTPSARRTGQKMLPLARMRRARRSWRLPRGCSSGPSA